MEAKWFYFYCCDHILNIEGRCKHSVLPSSKKDGILNNFLYIFFHKFQNTLGFIQPGLAKTSPTASVEKHPNINLLNLDECGWELWQDKISNGDKTELREYPWMALLEYETESSMSLDKII